MLFSGECEAVTPGTVNRVNGGGWGVDRKGNRRNSAASRKPRRKTPRHVRIVQFLYARQPVYLEDWT